MDQSSTPFFPPPRENQRATKPFSVGPPSVSIYRNLKRVYARKQKCCRIFSGVISLPHPLKIYCCKHVNSQNNFFMYKSGKAIRSMGIVVFNGTEQWWEGRGGFRISGKGIICIKVLGFAMLILSHFSKYPMNMK